MRTGLDLLNTYWALWTNVPSIQPHRIQVV